MATHVVVPVGRVPDSSCEGVTSLVAVVCSSVVSWFRRRPNRIAERTEESMPPLSDVAGVVCVTSGVVEFCSVVLAAVSVGASAPSAACCRFRPVWKPPLREVFCASWFLALPPRKTFAKLVGKLSLELALGSKLALLLAPS